MIDDDCRIDVRPPQGEGAFELEVSARFLANPQPYSRPPVDITAEEFDQMRSGKVTAPVMDNVIARVSAWLQNPGENYPRLDLPTILGFGVAGRSPSRVVFNASPLRDEKLRAQLTGFPIEMATAEGDATPLSLHNQVSSVVHQLRKVGQPAASEALGWPFKILIVRAAPKDFPPVPDAAPIADAIRQLDPSLVASHNLQVDVLSGEGGGAPVGRPTRDELSVQLARDKYHIVVFLCHGNLRETVGGSGPLGQLQLETEARDSDPLDQRQIATLLHKSPVPVVLLIGCLTAAGLDPEQLEEAEARIPIWLRGSEGVAQALINSTSGVQCAVGMRYRIDGKDAVRFLKSFFQCLLVPSANGATSQLGNVDAAVKAARGDLYAAGTRLSWAAPVVFRTLGEEPMFPFLASPPAQTQIVIDKQSQAQRSVLWETLAQLSTSQRRSGGFHDRVQDGLKKLEDEIFSPMQARGVLIMPERRDVDPSGFQAGQPEARVNVPIRLHKTIKIRQLDGTIIEVSQRARITKMIPSPALAEGGFEFFSSSPLDSGVAKFLIRHPAEKMADLPEGQLFTLELAIGPAIATVYQLGVEALRTTPPLAFCGSSNAIIVFAL
jgi:hypothetical protein